MAQRFGMPTCKHAHLRLCRHPGTHAAHLTPPRTHGDGAAVPRPVVVRVDDLQRLRLDGRLTQRILLLCGGAGGGSRQGQWDAGGLAAGCAAATPELRQLATCTASLSQCLVNTVTPLPAPALHPPAPHKPLSPSPSTLSFSRSSSSSRCRSLSGRKAVRTVGSLPSRE